MGGDDAGLAIEASYRLCKSSTDYRHNGRDQMSAFRTIISAMAGWGALMTTEVAMTDCANAESISVGGIALDARYAGFSRGKITDNEKTHPGYGYTVAYHSDDRGEGTIYIYNKGQRGIPDGPLSETVKEEFNQAARDVLALGQTTDKKVEVVSRYWTVSDRGEELMCAEFILSDDLGSRRTFVYVTGAAGNFVKIRVTLRTNDATDPAARNFADAVSCQLWIKRTNDLRGADRVTRGNVTAVGAGRYEVLGLVSIAVFGSWWWHTEDLNEPNVRGAIFRCYEEGNDQELAHILVADVSDDPDEPDITRLKSESVGVLDKFLENEIRKVMANDGRRLIRWMSSQLNETPVLKGLVTAYIGDDHDRERQYVDLRIPIRDRKVVVAGCFDVKRARELAVPIFAAVQNATVLDRAEN